MLSRQWRAEALDILAIRPPPLARFDLIAPRSRCPACGATVMARDNVPLLSWLILRGRCRACAARIAARYPAIELCGAVIAVAVIASWGYSWIALCYSGLLLALLALAVIDFDALLLPDQITLPLVWFGLAAAHLLDIGPTPADAVLGAIAGYLVLWLFYWGHRLLTRREGMGHGDFKLLAALGAWLGWQALIPVVLIASTLGIAYAATGIVTGRADRQTAIPFGTFLCIGGAATLFFGRHFPVVY